MTIFDLTVPAQSPSILQVVWLILVAVLWIGFFVLEGFDFGVSMLVPFLGGKSDQSRRVVLNTIGPHWDGNEVWLLTAGGATFAAFSGWYATLFSGLYLPLFLVLVGLILRGVAMEYRSKNESQKWRFTWDWLNAIGAFLPALVFGVGFANFLKGLPVNSETTNTFGVNVPLYSGTFFGLFMPFCLIGGLLFVSLFLTHGAHFVSLKTSGEVHNRAGSLAVKLGIVAIVLLAVFVLWGNIAYSLPGQLGWLRIAAWAAGILAIVALGFGWFMNTKGHDGLAFIGSGASILLLLVMFFAHFYPGLGFNNAVNKGPVSLDITTAASSPLTLKLMTIFAAIMVPIVLAYVIWSYWVFKRRLNVTNIPSLEVTTAA